MLKRDQIHYLSTSFLTKVSRSYRTVVQLLFVFLEPSIKLTLLGIAKECILIFLMN